MHNVVLERSVKSSYVNILHKIVKGLEVNCSKETYYFCTGQFFFNLYVLTIKNNNSFKKSWRLDKAVTVKW